VLGVQVGIPGQGVDALLGVEHDLAVLILYLATVGPQESPEDVVAVGDVGKGVAKAIDPLGGIGHVHGHGHKLVHVLRWDGVAGLGKDVRAIVHYLRLVVEGDAHGLAVDGDIGLVRLVPAPASLTDLPKEIVHILEDAQGGVTGVTDAQDDIGQRLGLDGGVLLLLIVAPGEELYLGVKVVLGRGQQHGIGEIGVLGLDKVLGRPDDHLGALGGRLDHFLGNDLFDLDGHRLFDDLLDDLLNLNGLFNDLLYHLGLAGRSQNTGGRDDGAP